MYLLKEAEQNLVVETLPNGVKLAILRSDASPAPIISVSVNVGHYHETNQAYGFSHLLEHMIFHRSENFNSSETLERHIAAHNGYINGWTHAQHTNFHASCHGEGFVEACTMLWDKINRPRFELNDLETEIAAIDEEFRLKQKDPIRALFSVKKAICHPQHPFSRFTVGNAETFAQVPLEELQQQLRAHHKHYYHSGNISICLKLPKSLEFDAELAQIKRLLSTGAAQGESNSELNLGPLYSLSNDKAWINVDAKSLARQSHCVLILSYFVDVQSELAQGAHQGSGDNVERFSLKMLRHLIESKHKHGLVDELTARKWVSGLNVSGGVEQPAVEEIQIHLSLTESGARNKQGILAICYGYIKFLKQSQFAIWRFNEMLKQHSLIEQYGNAGDPVEKCIEIAQSLHSASIKRTQASSQFVSSIKKGLERIISGMAEQAQQIVFIGQHERCEKQTPFYNVSYSQSAIEHVAPELLNNFMLSGQNAYIPAQLLLVSPEQAPDTLLNFHQHGVSLKFLQSRENDQPCGDCFVSVNSPQMCDSILHAMSKKVWVESFSRYIKRRFYQASEAGVSYRVYGHQHGLCIHTTGFSEKQLLLCIEIINCMINFRLQEHEFDYIKESIIKRLSNRLLQKPINQLLANLNTIVQGDSHSLIAQLKALEDLEYAQVNQHQLSFFDELCVEALLVGNWRTYAAQRLHQQLQSRLTAKALWQKPKLSAKALHTPVMPRMQSTKVLADTEATAFVFYQQIKKLNDDFIYLNEHATAIALMLEHILGPQVFLKLRNEMNLAYLVGVGFKPINGQAGLVIYLQSSKASASQIYQGIQSMFDDILLNFDEHAQALEHNKQRVIEKCQPQDKNMAAIARRLWANFDEDDAFYSYRRLQSAVADISSDDMKAWIQKMRDANEGQALLSNDAARFEEAIFEGFSTQHEIA